MKSSPSNSEADRSKGQRSVFHVVVVEDHECFRKGLLAVIASCDDFLLCGKAQNAQCAIKLVEARHADLAIINIRLKGDITGIELTRKLKASHPHLQILILSFHSEPEHEIRALGAGASAYLCKTEASTRLLDVLRTMVSKKSARPLRRRSTSKGRKNP